MPDHNFIKHDLQGVWTKDSDIPGPTAVILGGVHGNERAGIKAVRRMVKGAFEVPVEQGRVIVIEGNPRAIRANVRFIDTNLNREFKKPTPERLAALEEKHSQEYYRAQSLLPVLDEADAALDLHGFRQHDGNPFIITEKGGFPAARKIAGAVDGGVPYISSGWTTIEAGGTDDYVRDGLCYELGQLEDLKRGVPIAEQGILSFLEHMQIVAMTSDRASQRTEPKYVHATDAVLAGAGFEWSQSHPYKSWQELEPGSLIAKNGPTQETATSIYAGPNQVIIFPSGAQHKPGDEMFNLGTIIQPPDQTK